jgi:hypothetical protein
MISMKLYILLFLFALVSCASKQNEAREIEQKAAQTKISDSKSLGGTIQELIRSSKTLTQAQKKKLQEIIRINKETAMALMEKSYKFRAVLIQELFSGNVSDERVKIIEDDIKKIEKARLKNTFDTVKKISAIVSDQPDHKKYSEHLINLERAIH